MSKVWPNLKFIRKPPLIINVVLLISMLMSVSLPTRDLEKIDCGELIYFCINLSQYFQIKILI